MITHAEGWTRRGGGYDNGETWSSGDLGVLLFARISVDWRERGGNWEVNTEYSCVNSCQFVTMLLVHL